MIYYISAIICSVFYALKGTLAKQIYKERNIDEYSLVWLTTIIGIPLFIPFVIIFFEIPTINFIKPFISALLLNMVAFTFFFKAIKYTDISIVFPLLSTTPLFMIITSPIILNEKVSLRGGIGIIIITIGVYLLSLNYNRNSGLKKNLMQPFKSLYSDKGAIYAIIVAIIWSFAANFDKYCILESNPFVYAFLFKSAFFFSYLPVLLLKSNIRNIKQRKKYVDLIIIGFTEGLVLIFQFVSLQMIQAPYVIAIKRGGMFFAIIAGWLFFKEKNIKNKFIGAFFIMIGFVFILMWG